MKFSVGPVDVDLIDDGDQVVAAMVRDGTFEPEALDAWAGICAGKGNVLDVGAYTGLYGIAALKMGCAVWFFEANPVVELRLRENVKRNSLPKFARSYRISGHAIAEKFDCRSLWYNPAVKLTSAASLKPDQRKPQNYTVEVRPIDALLVGRRVDGIKIDVEGGELTVLSGAVKTIRTCKPVMIIELIGKENIETVRRVVRDWGYQSTQLDDRNWLFKT